jgi:hypothetical protein
LLGHPSPIQLVDEDLTGSYGDLRAPREVSAGRAGTSPTLLAAILVGAQAV